MMKTKGLVSVFAAAAFIAAGAQTAQAAGTETGPVAVGHQIQIMNNFPGVVNVYVKDANGHRYDLGRVMRDAKATLQVSAEVAGRGAFQIEVVPEAPTFSPWTSPAGVRTHDLALPEGAAVHLWLDRELSKTKIEVPAL